MAATSTWCIWGYCARNGRNSNRYFCTSAPPITRAVVGHGLPLSFRPVELATMGIATTLVTLLALTGRTRRWQGAALIGAYALAAVWYGLAGDR